MLIEEIEYRKAFFGGQKGILLMDRGPGDPHVCFQIISEDDGNWFTSENSSSAFWLNDLQQVLKEVELWLNEFANKGKWGWTF